MRLHLEATPEELGTKADELIKALVDEFHVADPDFAERLEKALPPKEPSLKYPVLRELHKQTSDAYNQMLKDMLGAIGEVLDQSVAGPLKKAFGDEEFDLLKATYTKRTTNPSPPPKYLYEYGEPKTATPTEYKWEPMPGGGYQLLGGKVKVQKRGKEFMLVLEGITEVSLGKRATYDSANRKLDELLAQVKTSDKSAVGEGEKLEKAGPYIGPRGGKWADPKHTIPWKETKDRERRVTGMRFIRLGNLPKGGVSTDHSTGEKELGVSVYQQFKVGGEWLVDNAPLTDPATASMNLAVDERPVFEVTGKYDEDIHGSDGEPLLNDTKLGRKVMKNSVGLAFGVVEDASTGRGRLLFDRIRKKYKIIVSAVPMGPPVHSGWAATIGGAVEMLPDVFSVKKHAKVIAVSEKLKKVRDKSSVGKGEKLEKAGPFIGPKGGKWADAKHTIPWKEGGQKPQKQKEVSVWKTATGKVVSKIPKELDHYRDWSEVDHEEAENRFRGKGHKGDYREQMAMFHQMLRGIKHFETTGKDLFKDDDWAGLADDESYYYHLGGKVTKIKNIEPFNGFLFFLHQTIGSGPSGRGDAAYRVKLSANDIIDASDIINPYDHEDKNEAVLGDILEEIEDLIGVDREDAVDLLTERKSLSEYDSSEISSSLDLGQLDWMLQGLTAKAARKLGYKAVNVEDEHGSSFMIDLLGNEDLLNEVNQDTKQLLDPKKAYEKDAEKYRKGAKRLLAAKQVTPDIQKSLQNDFEKAIQEAAEETLEEPVHDHTQQVHDQDDRMYRRVKSLVKRKTDCKDSDFEKNGRFYGWSTNELLDWLRGGESDRG